ncbi:MAG TPA: oligopeptide transporter, OPT family [Sandaracinaceae bacterium LLY-WYZ-13_1]|nr:oligopeptide transporter, OPT family [Sandaracinaceae bacterium LLY-WYZ-13_1]
MSDGPATRLPPEAYEPLEEGQTYRPVVPPSEDLPELNPLTLGVGVVVGVVFGAANAYLALKVGLTVSASIPAAVIAIAVFRALRRRNVLETNLVQTIGSAGESLAAGVVFTLPVFFLWGENPGFWPIFPLALFGGLLGVLFMIPLRRVLIVREHGNLSYPEGTACAEVQVAAQAGGDQARMLFGGMAVGALYTAVEKFLRRWPTEPDLTLGSHALGYRTSVGADVTPELLGVGTIIGPRIAGVMLAGGAVGWLVIIPAIYLFGSGADAPIAPETERLVRDMGSFEVWSRYLRYVGAGAVAFGGLFTLIKSAPTIVSSVRLAISAIGKTAHVPIRTEREIPLTVVGAALLGILLLVSFLPLMAGTGGAIGIVAGLAVVVFSFFFVTVSSRIVGLIGSSSNPISGMTIATVLVCALIFGAAYPDGQARVAVLTIGALVAIAAAISGDTSQDLKTGFLVGATPRRQQIGEVVGVIAAAAAMSTVLALFRSEIVSGDFPAPQANLIKLVIDGVLQQNLPWGLVFIGMALAFAIELMGLPTLAFAVGLYLPIHLAVPIMAGGLVRLAVEKLTASREVREHRRERGVLYSSGLIAGAALVGVLAAAFTFFGVEWVFVGEEPEPTAWAPAFGAFALLTATLVIVAFRRRR